MRIRLKTHVTGKFYTLNFLVKYTGGASESPAQLTKTSITSIQSDNVCTYSGLDINNMVASDFLIFFD